MRIVRGNGLLGDKSFAYFEGFLLIWRLASMMFTTRLYGRILLYRVGMGLRFYRIRGLLLVRFVFSIHIRRSHESMFYYVLRRIPLLLSFGHRARSASALFCVLHNTN